MIPLAGTVTTISDLSRSSFTVATRAFFPSSVVAPPRAPPKRAVLEVPTERGAGDVKALAVATNPSKSNDCFMVRLIGCGVGGGDGIKCKTRCVEDNNNRTS